MGVVGEIDVKWRQDGRTGWHEADMSLEEKELWIVERRGQKLVIGAIG